MECAFFFFNWVFRILEVSSLFGASFNIGIVCELLNLSSFCSGIAGSIVGFRVPSL